MICRTPDWLVFVFTLSGARITAVFANKAEPKILCTIVKFILVNMHILKKSANLLVILILNKLFC